MGALCKPKLALFSLALVQKPCGQQFLHAKFNCSYADGEKSCISERGVFA